MSMRGLKMANIKESELQDNQPSSPVVAMVKETTAPLEYQVERGRAHPLGAIPDENGVNFAVFSERATSVELLLFDKHDDPKPIHTIHLDPYKHRTFYFWHVYVRGLKPGASYAYRIDGPQDLHGRGDRFNRNKVLLDPFTSGNTETLWNRANACGSEDNLATSMRSVVIDFAGYDWEGDRALDRPLQ